MVLHNGIDRFSLHVCHIESSNKCSSHIYYVHKKCLWARYLLQQEQSMFCLAFTKTRHCSDLVFRVTLHANAQWQALYKYKHTFLVKVCITHQRDGRCRLVNIGSWVPSKKYSDSTVAAVVWIHPTAASIQIAVEGTMISLQATTPSLVWATVSVCPSQQRE